MRKIFISTSSFGKMDARPIELLKKSGYDPKLNPYGRTLSREESMRLVSGAEGLIAGTEVLDKEILVKLPGLKVISRCGAGLDNVDLNAAKELDIKVFNTPDGPTLAVAELVIGLIFSLLRKITVMDRNLKKGEWSKKMGNLFYGKRIGLIGFGRIGRKVAELAKALGAVVCFYDPYVDEEDIKGVKRSELGDVLSRSDIVSLHLSYSDKNRNLIGASELSQIKQDSLLINCARGGVVDEKALHTALKQGKLAGAAVDVFENEPYDGPLKDLDNVILTPHVGSYAKEARVSMEVQAAENLIGGLNEAQTYGAKRT
jgi:D-3-phosphoglycerate dehydrogenase